MRSLSTTCGIIFYYYNNIKMIFYNIIYYIVYGILPTTYKGFEREKYFLGDDQDETRRTTTIDWTTTHNAWAPQHHIRPYSVFVAADAATPHRPLHKQRCRLNRKSQQKKRINSFYNNNNYNTFVWWSQ